MLLIRKLLLSGIALALSVLSIGAAPANAGVITLNYSVTNLPEGGVFQVIYLNASGLGGSVSATPGALSSAQFGGNFLQLFVGGTATINASQNISTTASTINGSAQLPANVTATVTNTSTNQTFPVQTGPISIPSGSQLDIEDAPASVPCVADSSGCTARVSIAGGASDRKVTVRLPSRSTKARRSLKLRRFDAPDRARGSFVTTGGHFRRHGTRYTFTLNAAESTPAGTKLRLRFS